MKLFIWEGDGISAAYHDDGTLVVLAETAEQARQIAIDSAPRRGPGYDGGGNERWDDGFYWGDDPDSENEQLAAIKREPDRVVDLDVARVVAFNGGGYD